MIKIKILSKSFGSVNVIDSLSCTFNDTGLYLLYGESGSGKTTFLNILAGFIPFDSGNIELDDRSFSSQVDGDFVSGQIDYITQDPFFDDNLCAYDNLRLVCDDDRKIKDTLCRFNMSDKAQRRTNQLSGGERTRLALCRALLRDRKILLLDEPTSSLDNENKQTVFDLLNGLKEEALIICSSHDPEMRGYADGIIQFAKHKEMTPQTAAPLKPAQGSAPAQNPEESGRDYRPLLKKSFRNSGKSRIASALFCAFLILSFLLCMLADVPDHKADVSAENIYHLNCLTLYLTDKKTLSDIDPDIPANPVLDYTGSCPDGSEDFPDDGTVRPVPDHELSLKVLPFDKTVFRLSHRLLFGSWFTGKDQIILSYEMAAALYPSDPSKLIGQHISKSVYGSGPINFEVVGVFDKFTDPEKIYVNNSASTIYEVGDRYVPGNYENLFYVNSKVTDSLEDNRSFYSGKGNRAYRLYFKSFSEMKKYVEKHSSDFASDERIISVSYDDAGKVFRGSYNILFRFVFPISVFVALLAVPLYVSVKKIEFEQNGGFIAVFEYAGFSKKKVIGSYIGLNILKLLKMILVSEAAALLLSAAVNFFNNKAQFIDYQIFTYNPVILMIVNAAVFFLSFAAVNALFRKVRIKSWYENMTDRRDLI